MIIIAKYSNDGFTIRAQRGEYKTVKIDNNFIIQTLKNPRGLINKEIFQFLKETKKNSNQYLVKIIGEEDLLVLPAVLENENAFIFYGQPPMTDLNPPIPSGCVGIYSSRKVIEKYNAIFAQFDIAELPH